MDQEQLKNWKVNIFNSIKNMADLRLQKISWTGQSSIYSSSYIETINGLYDDYFFEEYIEKVKTIKNFNKDLLVKFNELDQMISSYDEKGKSDLEILNDPKWISITKHANEIIEIWITN